MQKQWDPSLYSDNKTRIHQHMLRHKQKILTPIKDLTDLTVMMSLVTMQVHYDKI